MSHGRSGRSAAHARASHVHRPTSTGPPAPWDYRLPGPSADPAAGSARTCCRSIAAPLAQTAHLCASPRRPPISAHLRPSPPISAETAHLRPSPRSPRPAPRACLHPAHARAHHRVRPAQPRPPRPRLRSRAPMLLYHHPLYTLTPLYAHPPELERERRSGTDRRTDGRTPYTLTPPVRAAPRIASTLSDRSAAAAAAAAGCVTRGTAGAADPDGPAGAEV
jgi:hypothetical protein